MIYIKNFGIKSTQKKIQNINQHASGPCGGANNINQNSRAIPPPHPNHPKKEKPKRTNSITDFKEMGLPCITKRGLQHANYLNK